MARTTLIGTDIFITFLDDAVERRKLGIKRITVTRGLSRIVYLTTQHATEGQLQVFSISNPRTHLELFIAGFDFMYRKLAEYIYQTSLNCSCDY